MRPVSPLRRGAHLAHASPDPRGAPGSRRRIHRHQGSTGEVGGLPRGSNRPQRNRNRRTSPRVATRMDGAHDTDRGHAPPPLLIDLALFSVALMWASTFTLFKIAWREIDPVAFTGLRFAAMFVFAVAVLAISTSRVRPRRADIPALIASGLTGYFLYQMGFVLGLDRTSALASAILISTHPIFSVIVMWVLRKERPTRLEVVGVLVGFLGVAIFLRGWDAFAAAKLGDLFSLGAAAAFGAYGVVNQPLTKRVPSRELMAYGLASGGLLIALVGVPAMLDQDWGAVSLPAWGILLYAIVGPVYLAYVLWNWAIRHRGIPRTVVYGFLVPVLGGAIAVVGLNESVAVEQVAGGLVVVAGLVITRLSRLKPAEPGIAPARPDTVVAEGDPA
ncbi:MAG: EamA family transporter [Actinobacteria bacterium]|nr:EamA family transporter [Actinomycetota bacterium]